MEILNEVLRNVPPTWEHSSYDGVRYKKYLVNSLSNEYQEIKAWMEEKVSIHEIHRIQNPYQYGRFLIEKEQREKVGIVYQIRATKEIPKDKIDVLCEYNYDLRRIRNELGSDVYFSTDKNFTSNTTSVIVIFTVLSDHLFSNIACKRDCEYYPEYIIYPIMPLQM